MRILFAGTPEVAVLSLEALHAAGHEIAGVLTREDAPVGRKRVITPSPVAVRAEELGVKVMKANTLDEEITEWVTGLDVELGVVVAYGSLLRRKLLDAPPLGWINLHFSTLPQWRGAAPVQRALMNGEQTLGMTVFRLVEALDAGAIVTSGTCEVPLGTTAGEALDILARSGGKLLDKAIKTLASNSTAGAPQSGTESYAHKLQREDGKLNPMTPATGLIAHWAGVTPAPGGYLECAGESLKIHSMSLANSFAEQHPELSLSAGEAVIVSQRALMGTLDGVVELVRVQPAGKGPMEGAAWLRGRSGAVQLS